VSRPDLVPINAPRPKRMPQPSVQTLMGAPVAGRKHNPTFDAPPQEVTQARALAQNLRAVLGNAMQGLANAVREVEQVQAYLAAHPEALQEFERLDISPAEAARFHAEALDVIEAFKPMEGK
jgi:hypothetical protein